MKLMLNIGSWVILLGGMLSLMSFSHYSRQSQPCNKLEIKIDRPSNSKFVTKEDVESLIENIGYDMTKETMTSIDIKQLEKLLKNNASIDDADVFTTIDGRLVVKIEERTPIIRIYNSFGESFYLDQEGSIMPLSDKYTARVLLAHGNINIPFSTVYRLEDLENKLSRLFRRKNSSAVENTQLFNRLKMDAQDLPGATELNDLFKLAQFINQNEFWKAQVSHIYVNQQEDIELSPRVGHHNIIFGSVDNMEEKFDKLDLFYKKGLNRTGWNQYETINLKFKNQVVCTKKLAYGV